jgi:small subunit ribosomal protein S28
MSVNRLLYGALIRPRPRQRRLESEKHLRVLAHASKEDGASGNEPRSDGTFRDLFQRSKYASILDPVNQNVEGEVLAVVGGNMYVDFGCKFHAVVPVPTSPGDGTRYEEGSKVVVRVLDLEMTDHFVGDNRDTSLLEAEAELVVQK